MIFARVMLTHILGEGAGIIILIDLPRVPLCILNAFEELGLFRKQIEAHLKDVVHFEGVAEALLLEISVDIAQSLSARRVLNSHLSSLMLFLFILL